MKHGMRGKWEREREQVKINGKRAVSEREGSASVSAAGAMKMFCAIK